MPRLAQRLLIRAHSISPYLPLLLRTTRELSSAINELRWLKEHVKKLEPCCSSHRLQSLLTLCKRRERGEPLQYILGSQPFGDLELKCQPGVLIPRPETEAYTLHLAKLLNENTLHKFITKEHIPQDEQRNPKPIVPLKILDLCSGSGCIPLLLYAQLSNKFPKLSIQGWDISQKAIELANENLEANIKKGILSDTAIDDIRFHHVDMFNPSEEFLHQIKQVDIIVSNPPYISTTHFQLQTTRSVRLYEPKLALVPSISPPYNRKKQPLLWNAAQDIRPEDIFYLQMIHFYTLHKTCKVLIMEIGDTEQALRVIQIARSHFQVLKSHRIEIWRDSPDQIPDGASNVLEKHKHWQIRGVGNMRAVVLFLDIGKPIKVKDRTKPETRRTKVMRKGSVSPDIAITLTGRKDSRRRPGTFGM